MAVSDIYSNALIQPKSIQDFDNEALNAQAKRQAIQANALAMQGTQNTLQQQQNVLTQRNALSQALQSGQIDLTSPDHVQRAISMAPDVAPGMLETIQKSQTARAAAGKDVAQAAHANAQATGAITDNTIKATEFMARSLPGVTNPQQLAQWYKQGIDQKLITPEQAQQEFSQIPINDPAAMKQWIAQKTQEGVSTVEKLKMAQQAQIAQQSNQTHLQGIGMQQSGENSRAALGRQQQLTMAGMNADGSPAAGLEAEAQMIASGKVAPPSGMAATRPATAMLMKRVQEINPDYDATGYAAKVKASKDFGTGNQGNAMRSFAVAGQHLDQLGALVDALNNKDNQTLNTVGNAVSTWNGNTPVTNFNAAKDVVSKEVMKAIVGGGGGVAEREELAKSMSQANSPQQLKGVISQYRGLMAAQHDALLQQRDAAGLPRSTLPKYTDASVGGADADLHSRAEAILKGR